MLSCLDLAVSSPAFNTSFNIIDQDHVGLLIDARGHLAAFDVIKVGGRLKHSTGTRLLHTARSIHSYLLFCGSSTPPDGFEPSTDCLEVRKVASDSSTFPSDIKGLPA